ncbi:DPP IV N-terminal domain-containing protein [Aliikangiella sp. IMCC44359]|uniref:DPP IV N-terminal domain-containing protein n=1 Tax=Aliikangiella sp. IMCC44359 TaxID=3459125 RepID=UPI00403ADD4B
MKSIITLFTCFILLSCQSNPQSSRSVSNQSLSIKKYQRAEQFLPQNITQLVNNLNVSPNWIGQSNLFWFSEKVTEQGYHFYLVNPEKAQVNDLFDHHKLAQALSTNKLSYSAQSLNLQKFSIDDGLSTITFHLSNQQTQCTLTDYQCKSIETKIPASTMSGYPSPDGNWLAEIIEWDLYLTNTQSKKKTRITFDGTEGYPYALNNMNPRRFMNKEPNEVKPEVSLFWSPDGKTLITHRLDRRKVGKLHLLQSVTGKSLRPRLYSYYYPLAGDQYIPYGDIIEVKLTTLKAKKLDVPPSMQTYYGGPIWGWWESNNNRFYFFDRGRANKRFTLYEYNPETEKARRVIDERNEKFINPWIQQVRILANSDEVIWSSERNNTQQLYLYQLSTGKLKNRITQCDCFVRVINGIDQKKRQLYFEASGMFKDRDPYFRHLFKVDLSGKNQTLLTPEPLEHNTKLSPDFKFFIDTSSTPQQVPKNQLKSTHDGKVLLTLGSPDISKLKNTGWKPPESFSVSVEDGSKLYGLIYKPIDFDASKSYPVIDATYTGPHNFFTPKSFWSFYGQESALAQLGFIVIKMDGRGTGKRDRKFHEYSYKNLAGGVDDHVFAIKEIAKKRRYMDINRVGIYGFSAGGYDTAQAMFRHADFFKVGISASGNHDFRTDKTGWNETWLSYPVNNSYDAQTNLNPELIKRLKGKLLLAHGELDENVNPAATLQLVDALMKANKDFDLMIYPNQNHVLNKSNYFIRKRWDYFVQHLLNITPPKEYVFILK